jgi:formate dehydrogenase (NADP+) beta subunit
VVSLKARHEMPASSFEAEEAVSEGVHLLHRLGPNRVLGADGVVTGLETLAVSSVFDADGRFAPAFIEGSEWAIPCDSVIMAIGQTPELSWLDPGDGVEVSPRGDDRGGSGDAGDECRPGLRRGRCGPSGRAI